MGKFIQVTLIKTVDLEDDALRMRMLNTSFIQDIGIDNDYQTVVTMGDGTRLIVDEGYVELSQALNVERVLS